MVESRRRQQRDLRDAIDAHDRRMAELQDAGRRRASPSSTRSTRSLKEQIRTRYETAWRAMADRWREGMRQAAAELDAVNREVDGYCPPWDDPVWTDAAVAPASSRR